MRFEVTAYVDPATRGGRIVGDVGLIYSEYAIRAGALDAGLETCDAPSIDVTPPPRFLFTPEVYCMTLPGRSGGYSIISDFLNWSSKEEAGEVEIKGEGEGDGAGEEIIKDIRFFGGGESSLLVEGEEREEEGEGEGEGKGEGRDLGG